MTLDKVIVPLNSPFTDDTTSLSEVRFARLVRHHIDNGAAGFVVCSEAGEVHALSVSERKQLVEWAVRESKGLPIYVNVSSSTTGVVVDLAQHADRHGAHAGVFTPPRLVTLNDEEKVAFASAVRRYGNLACSFLDPTDLTNETIGSVHLASLAEYGHPEIALYQSATPEEFAHLNAVATPIAVFGADLAKKVVENWESFHNKIHALFSHGRSFRVGKAAMSLLGVDLGHTRGPAHDLDQPGMQVLESIMGELG